MFRRQGHTSAALRRCAGWLLAPALVLASAPIVTFAASQPVPPSNLCIEGSGTCGTVPVQSNKGKKWHPGHYMLMFVSDSKKSRQSVRFGYYDQIASSTTIEGAAIYVRWNELETTRGNYTAGIAYLQAEINKLKSLTVPKRLYLRLFPSAWGTPGDCSVYPTYIVDMGGCAATNHGSYPAFWKPEIADRYIALLQALGAAFDEEPYLETVWPIQETATGGNPEGFNLEAYDTQLRRIALAASQAFKKTSVVMSVNFLGTQARVDSFIAYLGSIDVGVGGPDSCPDCDTPSYSTVQGLSGGVDYRGKIPIQWSVEASEMGFDAVGRDGGYTAQQIYDWNNDVIRASHVLWVRNTSTGTDAQRWTTGILPVINAHALEHTSCPVNYTQGCDRN